MSKIWKTGVIVLGLGFGCEEKRLPQNNTECNTTVPAQLALPTKQEEPKIELARIDVPVKEVKEEPKAEAKDEHKSADAEPVNPPAVAMAAKVVPAEKVKYNVADMNKEIFDNEASREEAKDDDLKKIKEDALKRLKTRTAALPMDEHPADEVVKDNGNKKNGEALFVKARIQGNKGRQQAARDLYLASCQAGFVEGCHKFAWHEEQAGNKANAFQFYRMACENGLGKSCNNLAFRFEQEKNFDKALDFYANACMKKHEPSCMNLKRLREEMKAQ